MTQQLQPDSSITESTTDKVSTAWSIAFGGFIIALGIATFLLPKLTPIEIQTLLSWLFIAVSGAKFLYLLSTRQLGNLLIRSVGGLLYFAMGISHLYIPIPDVLLVSFLV